MDVKLQVDRHWGCWLLAAGGLLGASCSAELDEEGAFASASDAAEVAGLASAPGNQAPGWTPVTVT